MSLVIITPPATEPITLTEAKAQCRIDGTAEDALMTIYIQAAREQCERLIGRKLITQTVEQRLDAFPDGEIQLEAVPVVSITSVKYDDGDGVEQTLAGSAYALDSAAYPGGWLQPAVDTEWPLTIDYTNCVRIRYVAGFGAASDVPAPIKAWLLVTVAAMYEQRAAVDASGRASALPERFADRLLDAWKVW